MKWYTKYLQVYEKPLAEVSESIINEIGSKLAKLQNDKPIVTLSIISLNEEQHLLSCLWSLSEMKSSYPIEIIGVDNNSEDRTAEIYRLTGIPYYTETQRSHGFARLCGLNHAHGKYLINIDSDTMYPPHYVDIMINALERPGVIAVNSRYSYIPDKNHSWLSLKLYEFTRDIYLQLQSFKRPELSVRGAVFAYRTDYGKKVGIRTDIKRGEDGSMALELKKYGKILFIKKNKARAVHEYGSIRSDGSLINSFKIRSIKALKNITGLFTKKEKYEDEESNLIK